MQKKSCQIILVSSKSDTERVRVCDQCDYEMENVRLKRKLGEVKSLTEDRIMELNMKQVEFTEVNDNAKNKLNDDQKTLDTKLEQMNAKEKDYIKKRDRAREKVDHQKKS